MMYKKILLITFFRGNQCNAEENHFFKYFVRLPIMFLFFEQDKFAPGAKSIQSEILANCNSIRKPYQLIITI